jgi:hypothetical protein
MCFFKLGLLFNVFVAHYLHRACWRSLKYNGETIFVTDMDIRAAPIPLVEMQVGLLKPNQPSH